MIKRKSECWAPSPTAGAPVNFVLKCAERGTQLIVMSLTGSTHYTDSAMAAGWMLRNIQKQHEKYSEANKQTA